MKIRTPINTLQHTKTHILTPKCPNKLESLLYIVRVVLHYLNRTNLGKHSFGIMAAKMRQRHKIVAGPTETIGTGKRQIPNIGINNSANDDVHQ